jgi:hypothetical protein
MMTAIIKKIMTAIVKTAILSNRFYLISHDKASKARSDPLTCHVDLNGFKAFSTDSSMGMDGKVCYLVFIFFSLYAYFSLQMSFLSSLAKIVLTSFYCLF